MGPRPIGRGNVFGLAHPDDIRTLLQWGRDQLVAETTGVFQDAIPTMTASMGPRPIGRGNSTHTNRVNNFWRASMGPRPIGRGNSSGTTSIRKPATASMGPRPIGRGNVRKEQHEKAALAASMGPRPIGRGNLKRHDKGACHGITLQWGRDQLVAETRGWNSAMRHCRSFNGAATNWSRKQWKYEDSTYQH